MEGADYGKLAFMKTEELSRQVNFLEREIAKLTAATKALENFNLAQKVVNAPDIAGDTSE